MDYDIDDSEYADGVAHNEKCARESVKCDDCGAMVRKERAALWIGPGIFCLKCQNARTR